ncbi:hypothetical protein CDAR_229651 [Caerostris darwini]|uniref:Uncharacterized protein n=1 Tax=Caerostris darwini TaxID=1538125 RepID=A0AAV4Q151_9ARAC|nr:hypothetical protein CDAR_229651 [Caerostris darwini]
MIFTSDVHFETNGLGKKRETDRPNGIHILQDIGHRSLFRWNRTEGGQPIVKNGTFDRRRYGDQKSILPFIISSRMKEKFGKSIKISFVSLPMEFPQFSFSCDGGRVLEEQMIFTRDVHSKTNGLGKKRETGRPNGVHILQDIGHRRLFRWGRTEEGGGKGGDSR